MRAWHVRGMTEPSSASVTVDPDRPRSWVNVILEIKS